MYRSLTYAYPSSDTARRFGCALSGCYVVSVLDDRGPRHEEPHNTLEAALRHYDAMPSLETHTPTCMRDRLANPRIVSVNKIVWSGDCKVSAVFSDGIARDLFSYYIDELFISDSELIGKTEDEAHQLFRNRDTEYLRSSERAPTGWDRVEA